MIKKLSIIGIICILIFVGLSGCNEQTEEITLKSSTNQILGGNMSYPGFYAYRIALQKGDKVHLEVTATTSVNLYVVPGSAHTTWASLYYHTTNPGLYYPNELAIYSSGQIISKTVVFTAPSDGEYDLVALNINDVPTTVMISGYKITGLE